MVKSRLPISVQLLLLLLFVVSLNGGAYYLILQGVYLEELKAQAKTVVANVEAFGSWVSRSGRVWVQDESQDYLSELELTQAGNGDQTFHFFSKNPALATREYSEVVGQSNSPAKFRMTSHNVMNPANAPDEFEQRALNEIREGDLAEYSESAGGVYRYAKPVYHKASCISCHGDPAAAPDDVVAIYGRDNGFGFKEGEVAGVISVSLPKRPLIQSSVTLFAILELFIVVFSIVLVLWFVRSSIIKPVRELTSAAEKISKGDPVSIDTTTIKAGSKNEVHQLLLATARMRSSFAIAMKKMKEARTTADKAVKYAKALRGQQETS